MIRATIAAVCLLFTSIAVVPQPGLNQVKEVLITSENGPALGDGTAPIHLVFSINFALPVRPGDLENFRVEANGHNISDAVQKSGQWQYPGPGVMRLTVPLPQLMAGRPDLLAPGGTAIAFRLTFRLKGGRSQLAAGSYDLIERKDARAVARFLDTGASPEPAIAGRGTTPGPPAASPPPAGAAAQTGSGTMDFPLTYLPPAAAEESANIGPAGGTVALANGASVSIPAGALDRTTVVALRQLQQSGDDMPLYHLSAEGRTLRADAIITLPVPVRTDRKALAVDVLRFHSPFERASVVPVQWKPGDRQLTARSREFSIIAVVVVWGAVSYIAGREAILSEVSNTLENFQNAVGAAIRAAKNKSVLLQSTAFNQAGTETLWCWAFSLSALLQTTRPLEKHLAEPLKPQWMAGLYGYSKTGFFNTGPSPTQWFLGNGAILKLLGEKSGYPVEIRYFARFSAWATYVISQLDQGYPVAVDIHAAPHFLNMVGYDESGVWVHESNLAEQPKKATWANVFASLNGGMLSVTNNYSLTTIIKRDIRAQGPVFGLNVPSCDVGAVSNQVVNANGIYFSLPATGAYAGFQWDGKAARYGMSLIAGRPEGPAAEKMEALPIGAQTRIGMRNIEVANATAVKVPARVRLAFVDEKTRKAIAATEEPVSLKPGLLDRHSLPEIPVLAFLQKNFPEARSLLLKVELLVQGAVKDVVHMALNVRPLILDTVTLAQTEPPGRTIVRITGRNLSLGEFQLVVEPPKAQPFGLGLPRGNDSGISIEVAQPFETLKQSRFYLRAKSTNTGSAAPVPFYLAGLESNRVDATWGGRMLEVPTSNDPVRIIPPPPK